MKQNSVEKDFLGPEAVLSSGTKNKVAIVPLPYERTTSYGKGTADGPQAIIEASQYVELYDEQHEIEPYKVGIETVEAPTFSGHREQDFLRITEKFEQALNKEQFPIGLGGEHAVSYPVYKAFHNRFKNLSVLQLDAHSDLRQEYEGSPYSHACVMKRIWDKNKQIVQVGVRSQCSEEAELIKNEGINTYYAHNLQQGISSTIIDLLDENVFITLDVDFFDPSIMPATGTPEPGGFLWNETLQFFETLFKRKNIVGMDIVELAPISDLTHPQFTIAKLIYKLIGFKFYL